MHAWLPTCMPAHCARAILTVAGDSIRTPRTGVTYTYAPQYSWELNLDVLQEEYVLSTSEPSLQPNSRLLYFSSLSL